MEVGYYIKGFIIGISIAAPVGLIGVLCIQRTLAGGRLYGIFTGLGAATADAIYGMIAAFGLTFISNFLVEQQNWFRCVGGIFLCYLGVKAFFSKPLDPVASESHPSYITAIGTTFFLTLTNPMTILSFAAIFAGLGLMSATAGYLSASLLVIGVFTGSGVWWFILSGSTGMLRGKFNQGKLGWVNKISGVTISVFGIFALFSLAL